VTFIAHWLGPLPGLSVHETAEDADAVIQRKRLTGCPYAEWFYSANLARALEDA
jgi:hypothetical protein